jgi:hypothetical protein
MTATTRNGFICCSARARDAASGKFCPVKILPMRNFFRAGPR